MNKLLLFCAAVAVLAASGSAVPHRRDNSERGNVHILGNGLGHGLGHGVAHGLSRHAGGGPPGRNQGSTLAPVNEPTHAEIEDGRSAAVEALPSSEGKPVAQQRAIAAVRNYIESGRADGAIRSVLVRRQRQTGGGRGQGSQGEGAETTTQASGRGAGSESEATTEATSSSTQESQSTTQATVESNNGVNEVTTQASKSHAEGATDADAGAGTSNGNQGESGSSQNDGTEGSAANGSQFGSSGSGSVGSRQCLGLEILREMAHQRGSGPLHAAIQRVANAIRANHHGHARSGEQNGGSGCIERGHGRGEGNGRRQSGNVGISA